MLRKIASLSQITRMVHLTDLNIFQTFVALVNGVAWPIVAVLVLVSLREPLVKLIGEVKTIKSPHFELEMGEKSARVFGVDSPPRNVVKKLADEQIVMSTIVSGWKIKLYANGQIVLRSSNVTAKRGTTSQHLAFPYSMVNEATSVQIIGPIQTRVTMLTVNQFKFEYDYQNEDVSLEVVICGL